ncbi:hypothetical protein G8759_25215 [Spirosoma aureum]|uniref:Uncharacterized protein n=1 Tax=Spirosoma aureum TaxID=2692134 RepID=A0A6G9AT83_9BACT|nr:hypothetical protein [Spirosoma aureum]QIP15697.1 hypothetical protein G8759_25215 [Spirosoma aureum]
MDEQEYIDYFENLARRHKQINHSEAEPAFYAVRDDNMTELDNVVRKKLKFPALLLDEYLDDQDYKQDNFRMQLNGGFSILCKLEKGNDVSIREARHQARQIARSILNRIRKDSLPGGFLASKKLVSSQQYPGEKAPVVADTATGWAYPFEWQFPISVAVNTDDWNDL